METPVRRIELAGLDAEAREEVLAREWLVTNGLGGYASSTIAGVNTRRYHGLLVAALAPPVERTVLVAGLVEWASHGGKRFPLATEEYADGTIDPHGYDYLESFHLDGTLPVWTFALDDALLERRVWMAYGSNTTYVSYHVVRADDDGDVRRREVRVYLFEVVERRVRHVRFGKQHVHVARHPPGHGMYRVLYGHAARFQQAAQLPDLVLRLRGGHAVAGHEYHLARVGELHRDVFRVDLSHLARDQFEVVGVAAEEIGEPVSR